MLIQMRIIARYSVMHGNEHIIPEYEMLHTQSKEYIIHDIAELMAERGGNCDFISWFLYGNCRAGFGTFKTKC